MKIDSAMCLECARCRSMALKFGAHIRCESNSFYSKSISSRVNGLVLRGTSALHFNTQYLSNDVFLSTLDVNSQRPFCILCREP